MLRVREDSCFGCGLCVQSCPRGAISIISTTARIDQHRCDQCRICQDVCPQDAIVYAAPLSERELRSAINGLKERTGDVIARIDRLRLEQS
ncbi:MAG: 4Fe-4S binding protein [Dehalococcoidia bacterium]|nr:4Fe-4S binding protein [Dehalococcoidia bacterium]